VPADAAKAAYESKEGHFSIQFPPPRGNRPVGNGIKSRSYQVDQDGVTYTIYIRRDRHAAAEARKNFDPSRC